MIENDAGSSGSGTMSNGGRYPGRFQEYADSNPGRRWKNWKEDFELFAKRCKISIDDLSTWMLSLGGDDIQKLNRNLPECTDEEKKNRGQYEQLVYRLDRYFLPKTVYILEHLKFRAMIQKPNERIDFYIVRLREQGSNCHYGDKLEIVIMEQIVTHARLKTVRDRLTEKDFTLLDRWN
jgi:hypothetical protein